MLTHNVRTTDNFQGFWTSRAVQRVAADSQDFVWVFQSKDLYLSICYGLSDVDWVYALTILCDGNDAIEG